MWWIRYPVHYFLGITNAMDVTLSRLQELVMDREAWSASMGSQRVGHNWATELNWGYKLDYPGAKVQYLTIVLKKPSCSGPKENCKEKSSTRAICVESNIATEEICRGLCQLLWR